jgi:hypothetical protein
MVATTFPGDLMLIPNKASVRQTNKEETDDFQQ